MRTIQFVTADPTPATQPANGVNARSVNVQVLAGGMPAANVEVTFATIGGTALGGVNHAPRATTGANGRAEARITSTRSGTVNLQASIRNPGVTTWIRSGVPGEAASTNQSGPPTNGLAWTGAAQTISFDDTGVVTLRPVSDNNRKIARDSGFVEFEFTAHDAVGQRITYDVAGVDVVPTGTIGPNANNSNLVIYAERTTWPSGATLANMTQGTANALPTNASMLRFGINTRNGNPVLLVPFEGLRRDGDYEVRAHLINGVAISFAFSVKDLGDVVDIVLDYGATTFAAGTVFPLPRVYQRDVDDYELEYTSLANLRFSISNAAFLDGRLQNDGTAKLRADQNGVITMRVVDPVINLVGEQDITIAKSASLLRLTPRGVGAVRQEVTVDIQLVDVDGVAVANGLSAAANPAATATILSRPEGASAAATRVDTTDFADGKATVGVTSNMEGDVTLRVIITEEFAWIPGIGNTVIEDAGGSPGVPPTAALAAANPDLTYGGRTYTGATTIGFGRAPEGARTASFLIGADRFWVGNRTHVSESPAFIEGGTTFIGIRDVGTAMGVPIEWDPDTRTAKMTRDGITVSVTVGESVILVTGIGGTTVERPIPAPAQVRGGRTFLPFRAFFEAFGYDVEWNPDTRSISLAF